MRARARLGWWILGRTERRRVQTLAGDLFEAGHRAGRRAERDSQLTAQIETGGVGADFLRMCRDAERQAYARSREGQ